MGSERDLRYGWGPVRPRWLQGLNTAAGVVAFLSLGNCFQSMVVNGLLGVVLSTMERRFELTSFQSSWIASAYEVGTVPVLLALSYIGSRIHRPHSVAGGLLLVALGSMLFFLPHFTIPEYRPEDGALADNLCRNRSDDDTSGLCEFKATSESYSGYLALFIAARVLHGLGATPIYILGVTFMDDCVTKEKFSLYVGIFYALGVIGPAIGTIGGGFILNIFTSFRTVPSDEIGIDNSDPRWIGAWWLPFIVGMGLNLLTALPISGYAVDLPGAAEVRKKKKSEAHNDKAGREEEEGEESVDYARTCAELPAHLKAVFTNPTFLMLTLFICCDSLIIAGFTAFGPKYLENQYSLPASSAGSLFGIVLLPAGAGGTILGGAIIERMRLKCRQILRAEIVLTVLICLFGFIFFFTCDNLNFAGVTESYNTTLDTDGSQKFQINDTCNMDCACKDISFNPVCSHENVRYFSPCHAGCSGKNETEKDTSLYFDCSCIPPPGDEEAVWATSDECTSASCRYLPVFLALFFIEVLMIFMCNSMNISATVRSVPARYRSMAISVQWICLRLLGSIPGPIAFGAAFDGACLLWDETCDKSGSCLYYRNSTMALYLFILCFGVKVVSLIAVIVGLVLYKPPPEDPSIVEVSDNRGTDGKEANGDIALQNGAAGHPDNRGIDNPCYTTDSLGDSSPKYTRL